MSQYITIEELKTHARDEEISAIIRDDESIALASIDMAIEFAEGKLNQLYDTEIIFAKTGGERSPLLVGFIKDIAMWYLIGLANPSIDYEDKKFRYQEAVAWFKDVYKGMPLSATNFPKKEITEDSEASSFSFKSNTKRNNYY